jgi:hypothetical protein
LRDIVVLLALRPPFADARFVAVIDQPDIGAGRFFVHCNKCMAAMPQAGKSEINQ